MGHLPDHALAQATRASPSASSGSRSRVKTITTTTIEVGAEGARGRQAISELVGGHSHDVADRSTRPSRPTAPAACPAGQHGRAGGHGDPPGCCRGSVRIGGAVGDTLHNVADALTTVALLVAFSLARRAATKRFTYGYGRAEDLAGLFVLAMIALSSALAAYTAITRLLNARRSATCGPWLRPASSGSSATSSSRGTGSGWGDRSARQRSSPTACTPALRGSPAWPSSSAPVAWPWAGRGPTRWWGY